MADTSYNMGQYRYTGNEGDCMTEQDITVQYLDWQIETESSPWYRDIFIRNNSGFEADVPYYLTFSLPRDLNYNLALALKFVTFVQGYNYMYSEENTPFQFVKYIEVPRTTNNGTTNSLVCLYKIRGEGGTYPNPRTAISNKPFAGETYVNKEAYVNATLNDGVFYEISDPQPGYIYFPGVLYHNRRDDTYWMFKGAEKVIENKDRYGEDNILEGTNDVMLNWIWEVEQTTALTHFKLIITPRKNSYTGLVLQMKRIQEDSDIATDQVVNNNLDSSNLSSNGKPIYGRWININQAVDENTIVKDTFKLYRMIDLNFAQLDSKGRDIVRMGIWGHPELMMAINGEEIKIGPTGYYELNDFTITDFAVAADGPNDVFVLDYQYALD